MDGFGLGLLFGGFAGIMLTLAAQWFERNVWLRWPWEKDHPPKLRRGRKGIL